MDNPAHDQLSGLKGVEPDQAAPAPGNGVNSRPRSDSGGGRFAPQDRNVLDLDFDKLRMDSATRPAGEFDTASLGQGISIVGASLVQGWHRQRGDK